MVTAPTGTVTFLFTDIEGSTRRWERDSSAMAEALERHDAILRTAIEAHNGHVFKTVGDAFCAAFTRVEEAVAAAVALNRELAAENFEAVDGIRVRAAIHTGTTNERAGDYFGPTVNRVARLLSTTHGGQIVLSSTAASLCDRTRGGVDFIDLGEHSLKDLGRPEHVFQVKADGLPSEFPRLTSIGVIANNLPSDLTRFVGRSAEIRDISDRLLAMRGVTLVGTGGIGKTSCALRVARNLLERFHNGVWLIELSGLTERDDVAPAVASVLGVTNATEASAVDAVCEKLANQAVLLVLDNCEHVIDEAARTVETLLRRCPHVRVLATSREALSYRGEAVVRLPSLALPAKGVVVTSTEALRYDAIALFVERAREVSDHFTLDDSNLGSVVAVCRRLDGIALAIELAARRLRVFSVDDLVLRLERKFTLLTGNARTVLKRQQTMRAVIDWSYDLLTESERRTFRALSVFPATFGPDACALVCGDAHDREFETLDIVASLIEKSMIGVARSDPDDREKAFSIAETLREYAAEKLAEAGELRLRKDLHVAWTRNELLACHADWLTMPSAAWERRYGPTLENVRSALAWCSSGDGKPSELVEIPALARRLFGALSPDEGLRWIDAALRTGVDDRLRSDLVLARAQMHTALRRTVDALADARSARAAFALSDDEPLLREAQIFEGYALAMLGESAEARCVLLLALDFFEKAGVAQFCGIVLNDLGIVHTKLREFDTARVFLERALSAFKETENLRGLRSVTINLAELHHLMGDTGRAVERISSALTGAFGSDAIMLANLAAYYVAEGRYEEAVEYARESIRESEPTSVNVDTLVAFQHIAAAAILANPLELHEDASPLFGYVENQFASIGYASEYTEQAEFDRARVGLLTRADHPQEEGKRANGRSWGYERALEAAMRIRL